jgi:hypothetical protein
VQLLTRPHLAYLGAVLAILLGLADPARTDAADDPVLPARLESSRWEGLSVRYPPSVLRIAHSRSDQATTLAPEADRLMSEGGDLEVTIDADDMAVGSAGEYIRIDLNTDLDTQPSVTVTYRARGKTWEVASGLIGDKVFYYKAVESCPPVGCNIPIVSNISSGTRQARKPSMTSSWSAWCGHSRRRQVGSSRLFRFLGLTTRILNRPSDACAAGLL